jgi:HAD superfamily hydrolase (TIGR01509 family)
MDGQAITFDFHNTLAACPEWFELEVRRLPSAFLGWWSEQDGQVVASNLLEEADGRYRQLRKEIMEHGNELRAEACLEIVFDGMQLEVPEDDVRLGVEHLMREALTDATPIRGAVATVREIHRMSVPIGIVSSAVYHPFLEWTLELFGIWQAFGAIVTSASAGYYKSRPEIYEVAADALGASPERMVHVGDSLRFDVGGANRAGMGTVWLREHDAGVEDLSIEPDLTLSSLELASPKILALLQSRQPDRDRLRV